MITIVLLLLAAQPITIGAGEIHNNKRVYRPLDISQMTVSPERVDIRLFSGRKLRLKFPHNEAKAREIIAAWRPLLDNRLVAALPAAPTEVEWEVPVQLKRLLPGPQGVLRFTKDTIIFATDARGQSRIWRYDDIDNISSADPFELTISTHERHHRLYNFTLKQRTDQKRIDAIWRRLQRQQGLEFLDSLEANR